MDEAQFRTELEEAGYQILKVSWQADTVNDTHTHEFSARLMCLEGTVSVTLPDGERKCKPGDTIEVKAGTEHREVIGPEGVSLLVGRKRVR